MQEFDKDTIESLLRELGKRLSARGVHAEVFVLGGSAMAMAYSSRRVTMDIDAIFEPVEEVEREVEAMAKDMRLPKGWLNNAVRATLNGVLDDDSPRTAFEGEGVTVSVASPEYILALKSMIHSRELDRDIEDAAVLCNLLGIDREDKIEAITRRYFGKDSVFGAQELRLERIIDRAETLRAAGVRPPGGVSADQMKFREPSNAGGPCGHWMKISRRYCRLLSGHKGQHR